MKNILLIIGLLLFLSGQTPVNIITVPAETSIYLDSEELGETPLTAVSIDTGLHELTFERKGYVSVTENIHIGSARELDIELRLTPLIPVLFITAEEGLIFEWDGQHRWTHNKIRFEMERGRHQLGVYRNREQIDERVFSIEYGRTIDYSYNPDESAADTVSASGNGLQQ